MDERIDSLYDSQAFSALDDNSGYWKLEVNKVNLDNTAFTCRHGLYQFIRMVFGLKSALATF